MELGGETKAQVLVPTGNVVQADVDFYKSFGFRLDNIYPSDDPAFANMSGHGLSLALQREQPGTTLPRTTLVLTTERPSDSFPGQKVSPGGVEVVVRDYSRYKVKEVRPTHAFEVTHFDEKSWSVGRAGMLYRDLVPSRLGGGIVASHIRIPTGGPVPDFVHFHDIAFQLIFCVRGWVRLVYEDQGEPFVLHAGDCVTQPPRIRHRVLESSDMLEVMEVGVPDEHMTTLDHDMELPTKTHRPHREWSGQRFVHHRQSTALWNPSRVPGLESCDTGVCAATKGLAGVSVIRPSGRGGVGG
eukprot:Hpha_TRINITY_DN5469_c0_g1::TRINITY_DN5469_c0_g1_i2::g.192504::m.192504